MGDSSAGHWPTPLAGMVAPVINGHKRSFAAEHGIVGIKGYRTVGGFRASIYNAMPESGVDTLIEAMKEFEKSQV